MQNTGIQLLYLSLSYILYTTVTITITSTTTKITTTTTTTSTTTTTLLVFYYLHHPLESSQHRNMPLTLHPWVHQHQYELQHRDSDLR